MGVHTVGGFTHVSVLEPASSRDAANKVVLRGYSLAWGVTLWMHNAFMDPSQTESIPSVDPAESKK